MQLDPRLMLKMAVSYQRLTSKQIHFQEFLYDFIKTLFGDAVNISKEDFWKVESLIKGSEKFYTVKELKMLLGEYNSGRDSLSFSSAHGFMEFLERKNKS